MTNKIRSSLSFLFALILATTALAQELPQPGSSTVFLRDARAAAKQLVGRGIELPGGVATAQAFDASGNEIVWREVRRSTDPLGYEHVAYRQHVVGRGFDTELFGSEVAVHLTPSGAFHYLGGEQFEKVSITNRPRFSRLEAVRRASDRLRTFRGEQTEEARPVVSEVVAYRVGQTNLRLVQFEDEFRFAYFTFAEDERGGYHSVVIDAEDDRLLGMSEANPGSNCAPSDRTAIVTAIGIPVRAGVANRALKASASSTRPAPYTHEGYYHTTSATAYPSQSVYQETSLPSFKCDVNVSNSYTLFPLITDGSGTPIYDDIPGEIWEGRAAGDALFHTYETMRAFGTLGRKGWDGSNTEARIIVESSAGNVGFADTSSDQAQFIWNSKDGRAPSNVVVIGPTSLMYNAAASLDLVAHEWGHGVIFDEVGIPYVSTVNKQIHEGYADVIGNIVEKLRQPSGGGLEQSSDWKLQEDSADGGYTRGAYDDHDGHNWNGPYGSYTFNDRIHKLDSGSTTVHSFGNMLTMAYRLLAEGGRNPICDRSGDVSGYLGCETNFTVSGVGVSKANRIMFQALYEMPSTVSWTTIANYVNEAAYKLYNGCSVFQGNAQYEQQAVADAFHSIGYPRTASEHVCP